VIGTASKISVLHFAESDDTSGFFPQLAKWHDRDRYRMLFGALKPIAPWLREFMEREGVACMSCEARTRAQYPLGLARLIRYLRRERVGILHTHLFEPSAVGLLAGVLAGTRGRVMTRHYSNYHTRIGKRWHVRVDQLCNRMSHAVIAVSQHTADHIVHEEGAPREKVHVVVNGIDFSRVKTSGPDAPARLRREWCPDGGQLLVIPGRLHPEKGHTYFFQALPLIRQRLACSVVVLVVGAGPFESAYREEVRSLGCEDIVRFLGFRRDIPDIIAAADLVVLPSVAEAFGLVVAEALYLGTPIVATHVGGIPEIVEEGVDGVLVPPADSKALAGAIVSLLGDSDRRRRLANAGRERVRERFGFEKMMRAYEQQYEHLFGVGPPKTST
jgi:glycosyltransferase involved in cell wall biosynthesis